MKSTVLAICLPLLVVIIYLGPFSRPSPSTTPASPQWTAEESARLWEECNSFYRQGKYPEALQAALQLHDRYPGNHIYLEMLAETYDHLGQYQKESEFWELYFDQAPNPVTACPQIGQAYQKQGREREAIHAFERCLGQQPDNSDSIFFLARAVELSGDKSRAAELYERGINLAPNYLDLQLGLARVWLRQGKADGARKLVLKVLQKSPDNVDALLLAGLIDLRAGNLFQAKQYLQRGVAFSDGYLDFHFALAEIAEKEKRFPEAIRHYDRILQDHPEDRDARSKRDRLAKIE